MRLSEFSNRVKQSGDLELEGLLKQERENLYKMRQQIALKQLDNHQALTDSKRRIARILTETREREIKRGKGS